MNIYNKDNDAGGTPAFPCAGGTPAFPQYWHSRGYLPHYDKPGLIQSITFRLFDSVPKEVIDQWKRELDWSERVDAKDPRAFELRKRIEDYADQGCGACWLRRPDCAGLLQEAFLCFDSERYRLLEWCVMPNHAHVLIELFAGNSQQKIIHSWKSFTSKQCNRLLDRQGRFWMPDYFDRYVRGPKHFRIVTDYIRDNPVKAGLCQRPEEWPWSSARERGHLVR